MRRRTPASTLTAAMTLTPSRAGQRLSLQGNQFRRTAARRLSICSTVSSVSVEENQLSAVVHPWKTFENHIKAIDVQEVQLEAKTIGRPPSADFQKVLHEFKLNEVPAENRNDLDMSLSEDLDAHPAAIANDLTTGTRNTSQRMAKGSYYVRGLKEENLLARGNLCVRGHLDSLTKGRSENQVGKKVPEDSPPSESVLIRSPSKIIETMLSTNCGTREEAWKPLQSNRKRKELTVDERIRQELYERYLEKPNSWLEGFVTDSGRRFVEELVAEGGLEGDVNGRGRGRRSHSGSIRKERARSKKEE